jgi:hypothetical protein
MLHTLGELNSRYGTRISKATLFNYGGAPAPGGAGQNMAFPWLTHLNRPFTSPMELMLVPSVSQFDLLKNFALRDNTGNEYNNNNFGGPFNVPATATLPARHRLLNFFQAQTNAQTNDSPQFNRLFDFVSVPSPYAQADLYYNANHFNSTTAPFAGTEPAVLYRPPFNKLSRFRDPGRVNINTIYDDPLIYNAPTLSALFRGAAYMDPNTPITTGHMPLAIANNLLVSRRGYTAGAIYTPDFNFPSIISNPYRAQDAGDLVPNITGLQRTTVDTGLLRSQTLTSQPNNTVGTPPLFGMDRPGTVQGNEYQDTDRNPYFRHQQFQKIGNLFTTQSNCYAVWVTIGYFEVDTVTPGQAWPDGYTLGQEIGLDSGNVTRHRAFYIIDRSIPVGFLPGSRLNMDDCILVRRLLE